jgi:hypothetical protein
MIRRFSINENNKENIHFNNNLVEFNYNTSCLPKIK